MIKQPFQEVARPDSNNYCHRNKLRSSVSLISGVFGKIHVCITFILWHFQTRKSRKTFHCKRRLLNRMAVPKHDLAPSRKVYVVSTFRLSSLAPTSSSSLISPYSGLRKVKQETTTPQIISFHRTPCVKNTNIAHRMV